MDHLGSRVEGGGKLGGWRHGDPRSMNLTVSLRHTEDLGESVYNACEEERIHTHRMLGK